MQCFSLLELRASFTCGFCMNHESLHKRREILIGSGQNQVPRIAVGIDWLQELFPLASAAESTRPFSDPCIGGQYHSPSFCLIRWRSTTKLPCWNLSVLEERFFNESIATLLIYYTCMYWASFLNTKCLNAEPQFFLASMANATIFSYTLAISNCFWPRSNGDKFMADNSKSQNFNFLVSSN